jgi:inosine-uridine nucleoside N-ribohydrolase
MLRLLMYVLLLVAATGMMRVTPVRAAPSLPKVILDTDIGDDIDDAYALALLVHLHEAQILGVTTTFGHTQERAQLAAKLLSVMGQSGVPVHAGRQGPASIQRQYDWAKAFHSRAVSTQPAADFMAQEIRRYPGQVTLIGIGALTNMGDLLTAHPELKGDIKQIVIMGGSVYTGYNGQAPPSVEWNIKCDPKAASVVFASGVPLTMAGLEVTTMMKLDQERQKKLFAAGTATTDALAALTNLWGGGVPTLYDPVATAYALGHSFCDAEKRRVVVDDNGATRIVDGDPNVTVLVNPRKDEFLDWYIRSVGQVSSR